MDAPLTNRDLYRDVLSAADDTSRSLEEYLTALWALGRAHREQASLAPETFAAVLIQAATAPAPPFDDAWRTADLGLSDADDGYDAWEKVIISQVADLRDFAEGAPLSYPELGVDAPRAPGSGFRAAGRRWYNHSVPSYLECGLAGAFGGWDPDDGIRKELDGPTTQLHPEPDGETDLPPLTWPELTEFLVCGQQYE
ncbi:hypothetical protein [Phytoactinopolyspora limicola]|uniref:hypothetical protein n=1 Tax=Phytoactinopolyspora limicola TaxID=2715536 RepID=UPI0014088C37|nr:hypothetical protein [Phytoactinopolyspora limicola]